MGHAPPFQLTEIPGTGLAPWLDRLGSLRIEVFREFPYLYDGTLDYEREYLGIYQKSPRSLVVIALDQSGDLVGATTCMPLAEESAEFREPFERASIDPSGFLYFGESIVRRAHRGAGLGREFFARREAHARRLGLFSTTFCAVDRCADHPQRPPEYQPLDAFWSRLGYTKRPELQASFSWKETGETTDSPKTLTFWTKSWTT